MVETIVSEASTPNSLIIQDDDTVMLIERRSFRPFKTSEEYLYAMKEDLAEWLNSLYSLSIDVDNFFEKLENGVALCRHSNGVRKIAQEQRTKVPTSTRTRWEVPHYDVYYRPDAASGSFFARDNVHNFIKWCRDLGVHDVLMFETDDLVLRKNEKHVILALLEIARRGARFGMQAPLLVQMEADIDREIESDRIAEERRLRGEDTDVDMSGQNEQTQQRNHKPPLLVYGPQPQIVTNDLKSLDEMVVSLPRATSTFVRDLVERCTCPSQFPMVKVSEGKYRIGDTKVLIFVRILRNHVMVRVGGGWDTLHHYLDKHDPCRCKSGHRFSNLSKVGYKHVNATTGDRQLSSVTYERSDENFLPGSPMGRRKQSKLRKESLDANSLRQRSQSPAVKSDDANPGSPDVWCDSSSEVSDEGYKSTGCNQPCIRIHKATQLKTPANDFIERPDSSLTHASSDGSASTDDIDTSVSPPRSPPVSSPNKSILKPQWSAPPKDATKSKFSFLDNIQSRLSVPKKAKKVSAPETARPAWNAGPRKTSYDSRTRRSSSSEPVEGRSLSRSQSASSDGAFDISHRQSFRTSPRKTTDAGKKTWNGRVRDRDYPILNSQLYQPPPRSVRSASASPATSRRRFPVSAPTTPARSPKRSMPSTVVPSPNANLPSDLLNNLPDINADCNMQILAQLEHLFHSYKARVADKLAAEGKVLPPELDSDNEKLIPVPPVKITPRKSGLGSRIPAPVFFRAQQTEI